MTPTDALEALRGVLDPELGLDVVSLGLVRDVEVGSHEVHVTMTMTTPACPLSALIKKDVREALAPLAEGRAVEVVITFDPPWSPSDMSEEARRFLGVTP